MLTTERYLNAQQAAKEAVRKRIREPQESDFKVVTVSHYPRWFIGGVVLALLAVMIASFIISAGKQVAASGLMFDHLPTEFARLTSDWANASVISMLVLSELGAILFLVASGTIAMSAPLSTIKGHKVNITQWVLRTFAFVCAGYAILSNITITVLDPMDNVGAWLQWSISIFMPVTVLGLGVLMERIVIEELRASNDRQRRYAMAMLEHQATIAAPEKHEHYPEVLIDAIYAEIMRTKKPRDDIPTSVLNLILHSQEHKVYFVQAEYAAHQQSNALIGDGNNPFLLPGLSDGIASSS